MIPALGLAAPTPFQASYSVSVNGITLGNMESSLTYTATGYTYQKLTKANGLAAMLSGDTLTERSTGFKQGVQLSAQHYVHHHKSKRKDRRDEFRFTNATQVSGQYEAKSYDISTPANTVDLALLELRLMDDLANGKPLNYQVATRGKIKPYRFQKLGKETLDTPAGRYECEKVQVATDNNNRQTTIWLAPNLDYHIVRATHRDDGEIIEVTLKQHQTR
jgi:hypothetical protein